MADVLLEIPHFKVTSPVRCLSLLVVLVLVLLCVCVFVASV